MSGSGTTMSRGRPRALLTAALALVLAVGAMLGVAPDAGASAGTSRLDAGEKLTSGQRLTSPSGKLNLIMQGDGNLVLYAPGGNARWDSGTDGNAGAYAVMQGDGNLVVYTSGGTALWQTQTYGTGAAFAQLQDDGNFVVYTKAPKAVWQTGTKYYPSRLNAGGSLTAGQALQSPNGAFKAVLQGDGNFVLYGPSGWTWQSDTLGSGATKLVVQTDGNLVLYNSSSQWKWQTYTDGKGAGFLQVQDDGNLVLYNASSQWIWQTYTYPGYQPPAAPAPSKAQVAINYATQQLGKPYQWGGTGPSAFDCSGLTQKSWAAAGVALNRTAAQQYAQAAKVPYSQRQPGNLIFYADAGGVYHVALYIGGDQMIEAPRPGEVVRVTAVRSFNRVGTVGRVG